MKLEKLRKIADEYKTFSGIPCPACGLGDDSPDCVPCYCTDLMEKKDALTKVALSHIDALLDVAASAKAACFSPALLSDKTAMIMRMGELHAAIAKLEAVE